MPPSDLDICICLNNQPKHPRVPSLMHCIPMGTFSLIHKSLQILKPEIGNNQVSGPSYILDGSALSRIHLE